MSDPDLPAPAGRSDEEERTARATALLDEAQQAALEHGRAVVAEARAVRRRMLEDADQRRKQIIRELEALRATIDETIAALSTPTLDAPTPGETTNATETSTSDATTTPEVPIVRSNIDPERAAAVFDQLRSSPVAPAAPPKRTTPRHVKATKPATAAKVARPAATRTSTRRATPPADAATASAAPSVAKPEAEASPGTPAPEPAAAAVADEVSAVATAELPDTSPPNGDAPSAGPSEMQRRANVLEPLVPDVVRSAKRLLQDEQNSLLDAVRRARGKHEAARLLPEPVRQRETWTALLSPSINAAYLGGRAASGKAGRLTRAPDRVVVELAAVLCNPLRERIVTTIDATLAEGPYESPNELQRALGSAIGARFREWRNVDLEDRVVDILAAAYARGAYEAAGPAAMLQWLPDEAGRCPDCDDNALEPTLKGKPFPTGQTHPPAHPGCRCLALPVDA